MGTLSAQSARYVEGRRRRAELTWQSAKNKRYTFATLDRSFGDRPLRDLSKRAIERWLETIGHLSPATRRAHLSNVRGFCEWLVEEKQIPSNPCDRVAKIRQPRSVPRALPASDVRRLLLVVPDQRARAIVMLMVGCGLRCIEVSRLCVEDYDPDALNITVAGKGGHERILPVPLAVAREVNRYLAETGVVHGPMVRSRNDNQTSIAADTISGYVSAWMSAAGVKHRSRDGRSAHALRHTAASDVLDECNDLRVVQEMLGHQHLATTAIYLRKANLGRLRDAMEGRTYLPGGLRADDATAA